jgi:predicted phosphate transport protein (TIGR00153 family)
MPSFSLLPSQTKFFDLFEQAGDNLLEGARLLQDLLDDYVDIEKKVATLTDIENKGDSIVHEVTDLANVSLIAPIDHEDTQQLITAVDDALDEIESVAVRISIFQIKKPTKLARQLGVLIYKCAKEVNAVFPSLRNSRQLDKIRGHIVRINDFEHEADQIFWQALREVSAKRDDAFHFIIWKEIYERLESVTDRMEDIGDILQRVLIKNA